MKRMLTGAMAAAASTSWYAYRHRYRIRERALLLLANGSPVVMNVRVDQGTLDLSHSSGGVLANVEVTAVDYASIRAAATSLLDSIRDMQEGGTLLKARDANHMRVTNGSFHGGGTGVSM